MGHESRIELWSPNLSAVLLAGIGTDRLRRQEAMKTAGRENPNHGVAWPRNRAHGAVGQNRSRSIKWAEKQENFWPKEMWFFLTSPFIELLASATRAAPAKPSLPCVAPTGPLALKRSGIIWLRWRKGRCRRNPKHPH